MPQTCRKSASPNQTRCHLEFNGNLNLLTVPKQCIVSVRSSLVVVVCMVWDMVMDNGYFSHADLSISPSFLFMKVGSSSTSDVLKYLVLPLGSRVVDYSEYQRVTDLVTFVTFLAKYAHSFLRFSTLIQPHLYRRIALELEDTPSRLQWLRRKHPSWPLFLVRSRNGSNNSVYFLLAFEN